MDYLADTTKALKVAEEEENKAVREYCRLVKEKGENHPETKEAEAKVERSVKQLFNIQKILRTLKERL